jgi:hypothetical protein
LQRFFERSWVLLTGAERLERLAAVAERHGWSFEETLEKDALLKAAEVSADQQVEREQQEADEEAEQPRTLKKKLPPPPPDDDGGR